MILREFKMAKRILIVDDEPLILLQMSKALYDFCDFQGEIKTVDNGKDAMKEINRCLYNICFLDVNLPDLDGLDAMKEIVKMSPETYIVIMTGTIITDEMRKTIDEYASMLAVKPFDLFQIKAFVSGH